jgi:phytoene dehydrogenase-like protein
MTRVVIIGSGTAGLCAGAYLARAGCSVEVFDQADHVGGVTATVTKSGFSWDLGPMALEGFGPGEPADRVLAELGCNRDFETVRGDRGLYFPDFSLSCPKDYRGAHWRKETLKELFPGQSEALDRFYAFLEKTIDLITLERQFQVSGALRKIPLGIGMALLWNSIKKYEKLNAQQLIDSFFTDPKLKFVFMAILADMVILPTEYPALGIPFSNQENAYDRRIPQRRALFIGPRNITYRFIKGGCGNLVEALCRVITERGGKIHTNRAVGRILLEKDRAVGLELTNGQKVDADIVMVSGGARECFFKMIGREKLPPEFAAKIDDIPLMESIYIVNLGTGMDVSRYQDVPLNYYYGTYEIESGVNGTRNGIYHEGNDGFVIYIPSLHSPNMAPPGKHALTVYTIAPNRIAGGWPKRKKEMTEKLLTEAERIIPGLRKNSEVISTITPVDFGKLVYLNDHHSFGGYCPIQGKSGAPHETPFRGLWFIGSQSQGGPGVWTQLITSRNVVTLARKDSR